MRLLLGDDHRMFLDALSRGLAVRGHEVVGATEHVDSLVDLAECLHPDVCVLDVDFGGRSVLKPASTIRQQHPEIGLLLLSGAATTEVWLAYENHLVDGVVSKLCDLSLLNRAIERVWAGGRVVEGLARPASPRRPFGDATRLSARERAIVSLLARGASTDEMAAELGVSTHTVRTHVQSVLRKLGVNSRAKAATLFATMEPADPADVHPTR